MGCDIHTYVEVRRDGRWHHQTNDIVTPIDEWARTTEPFEWRSYSMFGFLAGVRDEQVPQIAERRGLPDDVSPEVGKRYCDDHLHSATWLSVAELLAYDGYDRVVESRFGPEVLRDLLGEHFFQHLNELAALGDPADVRVVMWFDN